MKKTALIIVIIFYSFSAFAQRVALSDGVSIEFPLNIQKINKGQALDLISKKFNNNQATIYDIKYDSKKLFYKINDILISIIVLDDTYKFESNHISNLKKESDKFAVADKSYTSYIKKGDHNSALVISTISGNIKKYMFFCCNDKNTRGINFELNFNTSDNDKATKVLNNLLASIKFKD